MRCAIAKTYGEMTIAQWRTARLALRASPPMQLKAKAKRHECPTCGLVTGSPNVEPKLNRSRLNLGFPWMLTLGGPLLWRTNNPQMPFKEPQWMTDRRITVCMPRVMHFIGVGWLKVEPGDCQTFEDASKQAWLEWRASKQACFWSGPAVEDPKLEQSRVMDSRSIRRLEYVRIVYFWTVTP